MPGTTPNRHYPYPLGTDPLRPAADIQKLAEALDIDNMSFVTSGDVATALANYVRKVGDTMTGNLTAPVVLLTAAQSSAANSAARRDFVTSQVNAVQTQINSINTALGNKVSVTGDTMTAALVIDRGTNGDLALRARSADPYIDFLNTAGTQLGYLRGMSSAANAPAGLALISAYNVRLHPSQTIYLEPGGTTKGYFAPTVFLWGKSAPDLSNAGLEIYGAGSSVEGSIRTTVGQAGAQNLYCRHEGGANANGQWFQLYATPSAQIGGISQFGSSQVNFNTNCDRRLKNILGALSGALDRLKAMKVHRVTWVEDPGRGETDAMIADEVQAIVPDAVTGEPGATYDATEAEQLGLEEGAPKHQQLDYSKLVPVLIGAVQELAAEVASLRELVGR